jgi:predicted NAD-dependent protein-ADP-ribosyltransferase YbiA (DUF1768 family)
MKINHTGRYITFTVESDAERADLLAIAGDIAGQQYRIDTINEDVLSLRLAGPAKAEGAKGDSVRTRQAEPINITYDGLPMPLKLIANLAETSFELDGRFYASVEGFWQGLKYPDEADRARVADLAGHAAKNAAPRCEPGDRIVYEGREIVVGTIDHWALMERACRAKFEQDEDARAALVSTGSRPIEHKVPVDSRTIPGVVMADIWTRIRADLARL